MSSYTKPYVSPMKEAETLPIQMVNQIRDTGYVMLNGDRALFEDHGAILSVPVRVVMSGNGTFDAKQTRAVTSMKMREQFRREKRKHEGKK